jgi:hypothetical protein
MLPPSQYYYTMISSVEYVLTENISTGQHESRFKMRFNPTLVPAGSQNWSVVAAYYDRESDKWTEVGIIYESRNFVTGQIEFYFPYGVDWNASNDELGDSLETVCPNKLAFAVMYTTVRPIDEYVRFALDDCPTFPDSTYYTPQRGPTTVCNPVFWAVLRQGEYVPDENTIDVYLDGIRIVSDGTPDHEHSWCENHAVFQTAYDAVSGIYQVRYSDSTSFCPPWYGCLSAGQHYIQFYTDNLSTHVTPFFVDVTPPDAFTSPGYVNHQIVLWADLTDAESGVDTTNVEVDVFNCDFHGGDEFVEIHQDAMTFAPIPNGYRASVQVQWEAIQHLWHHGDNTPCVNPQSMCVEWEFVANRVCLNNEDDGPETEYYTYAIDVEPPTVTAISPIGAPIDDDADGQRGLA